MIPTRIEFINKIPILSSGKSDRKKLPPLREVSCELVESVDLQKSTTEVLISKIWSDIFGLPNVGLNADFFELGGHSVFAAKFISTLRKLPSTNWVAMGDVYAYTTVKSFAQFVDVKLNSLEPSNACYLAQDSCSMKGKSEQEIFEQHSLPVDPLKYYVCCFGQTIALIIFLAMASWQLLIPWRVFAYMQDLNFPLIQILFAISGVIACYFPAYLLLAIFLKWVFIGKFKSGKHPLWGWFYFRWWLVSSIIRILPLGFLRGSFILNYFYRALGMDVGENVYLGTIRMDGFDLISIGDNSSINLDAQLETIRVIAGCIVLGRISIGKRCFVGNRAAIIGGIANVTCLADESQLGDISLLSAGASIPEKQSFVGSPSIFKGFTPEIDLDLLKESQGSKLRQITIGIIQVVSLIMLSTIVIIAAAPSVTFLYFYQALMVSKYGFIIYILIAIPMAALFLFLVAMQIVAWKWILIGRWNKNVIFVSSYYWVCKWIVDNLMQLSLQMLHAVYSSLYLIPYMRLLGADLGNNAEISTAEHISPDQVHLGDHVFIADAAYLGPPSFHLGVMYIGDVTIGAKTFIGNSALIPCNSITGSDVLVGVMSTTEKVTNHISPSPFPVQGGRKRYENRLENKKIKLVENKRNRKQFWVDEVIIDIKPIKNIINETTCVKAVNLNDNVKIPTQNILVNKLKLDLDDESALGSIVEDSTNWLGSPSIKLPRRLVKSLLDTSTTYKPTFWLKSLRLFIEFFRITVPTASYIFLLVVFMSDLTWLADLSFGNEILMFTVWPFIYICVGFGCCGFVLMLKWILVGRYEVCDTPLWSTTVWLNEFVVALCESLSDPFIINYFRGTPYITLWFRMLGVEIGSFVFLNSCQMTEFDLITIGNESNINLNTVLQTHLFEDRIMKMSGLEIQEFCNLGSLAFVLYDTVMQTGSSLSCLSLLMKGENLPKWTHWSGAPAKRETDTDLLKCLLEV